MASENDQRITERIVALHAQAVSFAQQAAILSAQSAALVAQTDALVRLIPQQPSGNGVTERIFKKDDSPRHFMEPKDAQGQEEVREEVGGEESGRERSRRTEQVRPSGRSGGAGNGGSDRSR